MAPIYYYHGKTTPTHPYFEVVGDLGNEIFARASSDPATRSDSKYVGLQYLRYDQSCVLSSVPGLAPGGVNTTHFG